jgi:hypothetical protein
MSSPKNKTYRQALISAVSKARARVKSAQKAERDYWKRKGKCPDDQIIYSVYESQSAFDALEWALVLHRELEK